MKTGVRDRARQESLKRIVSAARHLLVEEGYDAATLRKIAAQSQLALGTLFHYISDKRDLIFLIFNEEVDSVTDKALAAAQGPQTFRGKLLAIAEPHFRFLAREPELSRILLSEIEQQSPGMHLERYLQIRARLIGGIQNLVAEAQRSGEIQSTEEPELIARGIFFCFSASARWWLSGAKPHWRTAQRDFERLLNMIVDGLSHASMMKPLASPDTRAVSKKSSARR